MYKVWLVCNQCGYSIEVLESERYAHADCSICEGIMIWQDRKTEDNRETPSGDNFPKLDQNKIYEIKELINQYEIINSIRIIGDSATWRMVEAIGDARLRLRYRMIFLKLGGKMPKQEA